MKPDKETQKILSLGERIRDFVQSDGWKIVKSELDVRLLDLQDITSLPEDADKTEIIVRKRVIVTINNWIKDIEGTANQHDENVKSLKERRDDIFTILED